MDPSLKSKEELVTDAKVDLVYRQRILDALTALTGQEFNAWYQMLSWVERARSSKLMIIEDGKIVVDIRHDH